ncbi:M3 family metallopeptidase [Yeosuana sp. MJ-SS3]|uniref:M3 family metallopeptidase n=1 Tax=Gilvirhabdus luticola TaxID=3079858 RepID=A0ABU3U3L6_9FLAO|nr:M3 family metallopeptidase [Yeosuana sp. MJ-SS3]MDU8884922.1 M3 family metallopeptidase [Yeosuana sp. MJ-SS3]
MKYYLILLAFMSITSQTLESQNNEDNPFFNPFNETIDFATIDGEDVTEATEKIQELIDEDLAEILAIDNAERTFDNTMLAIDDLYNKFSGVSSVIYLMSNAHPDSIIRANALKSNVILGQYGNNLSLNEDLYKAVKAYSECDEAKTLKGYKAKFLKETIEGYERNGFALGEEDRDKLKAINDEISELGNEFAQNIASYKDFLLVSEEDMDGLSEDFKDARRQEDGTYKVDLSYPSYRPFMKYSTSNSARKGLYFKYQNRATPDNLQVLQDLLKKRKEMAELLGYSTYSEYRLEDRMAKTPEAVWNFENNLKNDLKQKAEADYNEILEAKRSIIPEATSVNSWESSFYKDILLREKYQLDGELVKEYFALDDVLDGLFKITQTIFDLEYKEVENPSVWHKDVRLFEVYKEGKLKGRFYLDLFPRDNKYKHAACFGIKKGKSTPNGYQIPTATLLCNFPEPTPGKPSLMPHSQVSTFFHEFGHVLHHMVSTADLMSQSGTSVSRDFVEAPSQIFENWIWNYDALKLFAKHYNTREVLPKELFDKMLAAKNVGSGLSETRQVFLGMYDMTLHDKYDPFGDKTTTDILKEVHNAVRLIPFEEGTNFQAAFGHLRHYASSYYGYMWSKVYAQDMFSVFAENGILDKETGIRYRDIILANGGSKDELELVKEFLGREPNNEAFLKELGL